MVKHYTARGDQIDIHALAMKHANTPALGNAKMNARGDILGNNGIVLKTQEQIEAEWKRNTEAKSASLGISSDIKQPLPKGVVPANKKLLEDQDFEPTVESKGDQVKKIVNTDVIPTRRKITDTDV